MELPNSANPCLAYFSANSGLVQITNNGGSTPSVISMPDRTGNVVATQLTVANQPTLGTMDGAGPVKYTDVVFDGSDDCLTCDALAANLVAENGALDFTVFIVAETASFASTNMDLFTLGKAAADGYIRLGISGSAVQVASKNDAATVVLVSSGTVVDAKTHTYALVKSGAGTYALYLDGTLISSGTMAGNFTVNTATIGALRDNSTTANYYTGGIAEVVLYKGTADITAVSTYFSQKYTATLG